MRPLLTLSARLALFFSLLLCACASNPPPRSPVNLNDPFLRRGEALLRHGAGNAEFSPTEPTPAVQDLGAQAGFGRRRTASSIRASVYLFNNYKDARVAEDWLKAHVPQGLQGDGTVNGDLLVWVTADATDATAGAVIEDLIGSFAGEE
ncbi:hypothetical protein [Corallococcus terminator]|uniref:Uncharacterized protein n=1 Tax=Corallococcus terminator TaxID=2316733 RepID=A0A3A8JB48_9BACT|nr:hypothetical protein [Corallococcus terminator]RKG92909.1 hypothetical protein D7V88_04355 [Corallococcus terminator]